MIFFFSTLYSLLILNNYELFRAGGHIIVGILSDYLSFPGVVKIQVALSSNSLKALYSHILDNSFRNCGIINYMSKSILSRRKMKVD